MCRGSVAGGIDVGHYVFVLLVLDFEENQLLLVGLHGVANIDAV